MTQKKSFKIKFLLFLKKWITPLFFLVLVVILQHSPVFIEKYYSNFFYQYFSKILRVCFGWLNFSIGDVLYYAAILFILYKTISFFLKIKKENFKSEIKTALISFCKKFIWLYVVFHIFWGFNYYRLGIAKQMNFSELTYTKEDVELLVCELIDSVNASRKRIGNGNLPSPSFSNIFEGSYCLYDSIIPKFSFLNLKNKSVKKSLFSNISHYVGFTGYYNPFSGEAQLSTDVPMITVPYTTCHEIAHQLGYASEEQANFVGYLACTNSKNDYFKYSAYLDLYKYSAIELYLIDDQAKHGFELDNLVRKDLLEIRNYFLRRENSISPVMSEVYSQYLKANKQNKGIKSYNEVVGLLIAYKKKYGKI